MMDIIPAIDLMNGACVRLQKGDFSSKVIYSQDPVDVAIKLEKEGAGRLHLVDLDGARAGQPKNMNVLQAICNATRLEVDFGGGIRTLKDMDRVLEKGASKVNIGSLAVKNPEAIAEWVLKQGQNKLIVAADFEKMSVVSHGWTVKTDRSIFDFLEDMVDRGVDEFMLTNIEQDGMLRGIDISPYQQLKARWPEIKMIASGGVTFNHDLEALVAIGMDGAIVGKAYYENKLSINSWKIERGESNDNG